MRRCLLSRFTVPQTKSLIGDLEDLIGQLARIMEHSMSRPVFAGMLADVIDYNCQLESTGDEPRCFFVLEQKEILAVIFARATQRGEWSGPVALDETFSAMFGTVSARVMILGMRLDPKRIAQLAQFMVSEAAPSR
ncbi:MAG: TetR-like C-terminal domain-containing protein [Planctomycetota bacterium]